MQVDEESAIAMVVGKHEDNRGQAARRGAAVARDLGNCSYFFFSATAIHDLPSTIHHHRNFNTAGVHSAWPSSEMQEICVQKISTRPVSTQLGLSSEMQEICVRKILTRPVSTQLGLSSEMQEICVRRISTRPVSTQLGPAVKCRRFVYEEFQHGRCPLSLASAVKSRFVYEEFQHGRCPLSLAQQ
ncbi:hypothetical protein J6590_023280 [Homalodisca vitripennis]|nr:hypothetical protein J6590_023280 [Homalodisca vitripennis]